MSSPVPGPSAVESAGDRPEPAEAVSRRPDLWFLVVGIPFALILFVFLPPSASPDAAHHLVRIDQIVHGTLVAPRDARQQGVAHVDGCLAGLENEMTLQMYDVHWRPSDVFRTMACGRPRTVEISNTAIDSPVTYLPGIIGYAVGRRAGGVVAGLLMARILGLLSYLVVCWAAIRIAPWGKAYLFFLALLPTSMTLAVSLSSDPLPISLGILAVALTLRLRVPRSTDGGRDLTRRLLASLAVCLVLLALAKNLYAVAGLLVLLVPGDRFPSRGRRRWYCVGLLGLIGVGSGAWSILVVNRVRVILPFLIDDSFSQRAWIGHHPLGFVHLAARSILGTNVLLGHTLPGVVASTTVARPLPIFNAPWPATVGAVLLAGISLVASLRRRDRQAVGALPSGRIDAWAMRLVPVVILAVVLAVVVYGEATTYTNPLSWAPHITFIEGRFFIPVLAPALLPLASRSTNTRGAHLLAAWAPLATLAGTVALAVWSVIWLAGLHY